jgi:hypothetical protein
MALAVIPAVIISFVVLVGLFGTYYIFQAYRRVRFAVHDVERTRHIGNDDQFAQQPIQLQDVEHPQNQYHSGQWYGSDDVVSSRIAPVAKPLPHILQIEYTGGEGLVSPPGRVFLSTEEIKESSRRRSRESDYFQEQELHTGRLWNFETNGYENSMTQQPELRSPKPVRTVTRKPKAEPANTAYDTDQTAASDIWSKIEKGELRPSRRKAGKKLPKLPDTRAPEVLRDPSEFEKDPMRDVDLGSSTREWAKTNFPAQPVTKLASKRESFDSITTAINADNVNIERSVSYDKRKQSIGTKATKRAQPVDRMAEARRKTLEAKKQIAERKKQKEEEDRQAEEQRQIQEQKQRAEEQQKRDEEEQRERDEERARCLAQMTKGEEVRPYDANRSESQKPSASRRSNTSTESKRERKSRERPLMRTIKRANTFANDTSKSSDDAMQGNKRIGSSSANSRSMSMNDQTRPDFNAAMPSIAEGGHAGYDDKTRLDRETDDGSMNETANPFSDNAARRSYNSPRTSISSMYSAKRIDGVLPKDTPENPFLSKKDASDPFAAAQRWSATSSNESRVSFSNVQRRSNASSNDSRSGADTRSSGGYPERNNSKSSAESRASVGSQSSKRLSTDCEKPERKFSLASRTLSKLTRKSSSSNKTKTDSKADKERDSMGSTQSGEHDGPVLRGGGRVFVEEPEEMSASEDENGNGEKDDVKMRGGASDKVGSKSGLETESEDEDESDASTNEHSENDHSSDDDGDDDVKSKKLDSSSEDEVSDDVASGDEHSESGISGTDTSDADASDDDSEEEGSDNEHE